MYYFQVIQRRVDGSTDFYRNWNEYENGFGDLATNFYIGTTTIYKTFTKTFLKHLYFHVDVSCSKMCVKS